MEHLKFGFCRGQVRRGRAQLITLDKAEGHDLKGIVYLRTVGEADDLIAEMQAGSSSICFDFVQQVQRDATRDVYMSHSVRVRYMNKG